MTVNQLKRKLRLLTREIAHWEKVCGLPRADPFHEERARVQADLHGLTGSHMGGLYGFDGPELQRINEIVEERRQRRLMRLSGKA